MAPIVDGVFVLYCRADEVSHDRSSDERVRMPSTRAVLRAILALVAVTNGAIGLLGVWPGIPVSKIATAFYSASISVDPQTEHITAMFAAYMLTVGVLAGAAALKPERYEMVTFAVAGMLVVRTVQRVVFASEQAEVFGISTGYYWTQTIIFLAVAILLAWLGWRVRSGGMPQEQSGVA